MGIFELMAKDGHQQLVFCYDRSTGLRMIIAIHDTTLGPAAGGCRMHLYPNEEEALEDVLKLSKAMTYKSAAAGIDLGGGKCIVWGDPGTDKSEPLFRALGRFVHTLGGRFITGTDMGTVNDDFVWARRETPYVQALPEAYGGSGDTAVTTAYGVWQGLKGASKWRWGNDSLQGKRVAVQGVGKVGHHLVGYLLDDGASCVIGDPVAENVEAVKKKHPRVSLVSPETIYEADCPIFSPNAVGGILNDQTIPRLKCEIVGGAANNQLTELRHADALAERGILYCPDFVINSGGLIQAADELQGYNRDRAFRKTADIYHRLIEIFRISEERKISTHQAAVVLAEERLRAIDALKRIYIPHPMGDH